MPESLPSVPQVRPATSRDRAPILETALAAFRSDPAFRYFFPTEQSYDDEAPLFVGDLLDQRLDHGTVWVVDDGVSVAGSVAMWNPPGSGGPDPTARLSRETAARIARFDAAVHALLPTDPYWYLGILATHPAYGGRGLGRLVMTPGLERAAADGLASYLETATAVNVGIYERYGWAVTGAVEVAGVDVRVMRKG